MEKLQERRGEMTDMVNPGSGRVRIEFKIPTRGLFGIRTEFLSETRGTGLLYHTFLEYGPFRGEIASRSRGALVSKEGGDTTAYAIEPLQERSTLFVEPGHQGLRRPGRRRELARRRHGRAGLPQEASDEHARVEVRHRRAAHAGAQDDARAMPRVDRRRRAGGSDAGVDPHPQEDPRSLAARSRAEARRGDGGAGVEVTGFFLLGPQKGRF